MGKARRVLLAMAIAGAVAAMLGLAACGGSSSSSGAAVSSGSAAASSEASASAAASSAASSATASATVSSAAASSAASSAPASGASAAGEATLSAQDLANVDVEITFGDYDSMFALSKQIQNGEATGKVVKIDGEVINFAKGMSYAIGEKNASGKERHGTNFIIEGAGEEAYPSDTTHVIITGKVTADNAYTFTIHTLPEFVEVVE